MDDKLSSDISAAELNTAYVIACKKLLAHKMILAWIMKSCLDEYQDVKVKWNKCAV